MKLEDFKGCIRPLLVLIVLPPLVASVFLYHARMFLFLYNSLQHSRGVIVLVPVPHHPHHEPSASIRSRNSFSPAELAPFQLNRTNYPHPFHPAAVWCATAADRAARTS
jgi:hypothetical protein